MATRTVAEAAAWMGGSVIQGDPDLEWSGGALDSRAVQGGELFFALRGESTDGHRYVRSAVEAGAAAAVVHESVDAPDAATLIAVDDTYEGLHDLTRGLRKQVPEHLVALTGSMGKTTTKEILAALLARRYRTAKNPGNLNNLYGFPLSLMGIPDDTEWMVAEMGMSTPGELGGVSRLGRPEVALFLNVRPVHLEQLGSIEAIRDAKAELLEGLAEGGTVVANADDPRVREIAARHDGPVVWYGCESEGAEYRASAIEEGEGGGGTRFRLRTPGGERSIRLPLHGAYNVENFLAAAACASGLGISDDDLVEVAAGLRPESGRGEVHRLSDGTTVIDDSYNSNPVALRRALEGARRLEGVRHVAVLGSMLELGEEEATYHLEAGRVAAELGFDIVLGVGELARDLSEAARAAGVSAHWVPDAEEAAEWVAARISGGEVVLVKGSRGVGLELVVARLLSAGEGGED